MTTDRKLATIRRVTELKPIEFINKETGEKEVAENIQLALVDGWQCVTLKSEFKEAGEYCIFFEIDSIIPRHPWNAHIQKDKLNEPIRLRTMRLKGYLSQGLALPLNLVFDRLEDYSFGNGFYATYEGKTYVVDLGSDLTKILNIEKYEKPLPTELVGKSKGGRPGHIPDTSMERIQNIPEILNQDIIYEVTEKLEGSSCHVYNINGEVGVCSRKLDLIPDEDNAFWKAVYKDAIHEKIKQIGDDIVLQGELVGPRIEGNIYNLKQHEFRLYSIYDIKSGSYYTSEERINISTGLNIKHVPIIDRELKIPKGTLVSDILLRAEGNSFLTGREREGLIFKSLDNKVSWKAISNKYLLKKKD